MDTIRVHKPSFLLILSLIAVLCQTTLQMDPIKYLQYYGYLDTHAPQNAGKGSSSKVADSFSIEEAVREFQLKFGLKPTGVLDEKSKQLMAKPRCGVPDIIRGVSGMRRQNLEAAASKSSLHTTKHWEAFVNQQSGNIFVWDVQQNINYFFDETVKNHTELQPFKDSFKRAFDQWAKAYDKLTFTEVQDISQANITIGFRRGDHSNTDPFDHRAFMGPGDAVAHAFAPPYGMLHFDADEKWSYNPKEDEYDIETIALHEIGHTLGLDHSELTEAVMYALVTTGARRRELHNDDMQGVQYLYGTFYQTDGKNLHIVKKESDL